VIAFSPNYNFHYLRNTTKERINELVLSIEQKLEALKRLYKGNSMQPSLVWGELQLVTESGKK
jgi:hypothetical protein